MPVIKAQMVEHSRRGEEERRNGAFRRENTPAARIRSAGLQNRPLSLHKIRTEVANEMTRMATEPKATLKDHESNIDKECVDTRAKKEDTSVDIGYDASEDEGEELSEGKDGGDSEDK
ncbi:hypothetical protein GN244_ATG17594 [Phytophthora infestans]|uniref:Uncharacterized protein n=1 Tax=Phytophthora infestans TaxID=4787 RepID=A0A833W5E4_PHYIN|nr:hypothetical protein GN244_ATG17594 [Phytophthora infestans]